MKLLQIFVFAFLFLSFSYDLVSFLNGNQLSKASIVAALVFAMIFQAVQFFEQILSKK